MTQSGVARNDPAPAVRPSLWTIARWVHPAASLKGAGDRAIYVWRYLLGWPHTAAWRAWLGDSMLGPIAPLVPGLHKKITRPYFATGWTNAEKLRALRAHYEFVTERLDAGAIRRMFTWPGLPMVRIAGAGGCHYRVFLCYDGKFNKEGEITLFLHSEKHDAWVSSLTAVVVRLPQGGHGLFIGALQGLPEGADKDIIKEVAKSLHGLRPKALLLFLAQELASAWRLAAVVGISNDRHVSRHLAYFLNATRRPKVRLSYDEFWEESGGQRRADGFYALPLQHHPRDFDELKPAKRPLYRRRYAMLEVIRHDFAVELGLMALPELFLPGVHVSAGASHLAQIRS
jgi:uncharacterized protein VirK/YbjX